MKKIQQIMGALLVVLLSLLITTYGTQDHELHNKLAMLEQLDSFFPHENKGQIEDFEKKRPCKKKHCDSEVVVSVDAYGAVGDGVCDDTQAFIDAWKVACSTQKSVLLVPVKKIYLVNATIFAGPCAEKLTVKIEGTIVAPAEPELWDPTLPRVWLGFANLTGVKFEGKGVIDGSGSEWWAASCKRNRTNPCISAPTSLTLNTSYDIKIKDLTIQNSQQFHFTIANSDKVKVENVAITAPADSPNTDGFHILNSTNVKIKKCVISTGDDCISIIAGSSDIKIKKIFCGPGHGISIGSLGKNNATDIVSKIHVDGAYMQNTTNGLRIKSWQGGSGYAKDISFENVIMEDVENPIIIDQFYCDSFTPCENQTKAVEISQIKYENIFGTTPSNPAIKFACSDTVPCKGIELSNVVFFPTNGTTTTFCNSVSGTTSGIIVPPADCLIRVPSTKSLISESLNVVSMLPGSSILQHIERLLL